MQILTAPRNALIKQYVALLSTEGLSLSFAPEAIDEIARIAYQINMRMENIGARRLHTSHVRIARSGSLRCAVHPAEDHAHYQKIRDQEARENSRR